MGIIIPFLLVRIIKGSVSAHSLKIFYFFSPIFVSLTISNIIILFEELFYSENNNTNNNKRLFIFFIIFTL